MAGTQRALSPKAQAVEVRLEAQKPEPTRASNCRRLRDKTFSVLFSAALLKTSLCEKNRYNKAYGKIL